MINKIKKLMGFRDKPYLDLTIYNKHHKQGLRLVKIPYNKVVLGIVIGIIAISILTPFTNLILFPLALWVLRRWG